MKDTMDKKDDKTMPVVIFTRGFPGCGKSTYANQWVNEDSANRVEINRDNIREMLGICQIGTIEQENDVTTIQHIQYDNAMKNGMDIIVSDTNMKVKFVRIMVSKAISNGYSVEFADFKVDFDTILKRNKTRPEKDRIPEEKIREMYAKFPYKQWITMDNIVSDVHKKNSVDNKDNYKSFINDSSKDKAILVDIDGTIAHITNQRSYYDYDERVLTDTPDKTIIDIVNMYKKNGYTIIVMSGREDKCYDYTKQWLNEHNVSYDFMYMRKEKDTRPDWIVKDELVREHIENKYYIEFCLDDRNQVVNHYREMGFKVLQVEEGDF